MSGSSVQQSSASDSTVQFDNIVVLDNEAVTVELTQFFEKEVNWAGADKPAMEKCFTLKVHNKSDAEMLFNVEDGYVNDESVTVIMQDGNGGPAPGKTKTYSYDVQYNTSPNATPLESIDDLYTFECKMRTIDYNSDKSLLLSETEIETRVAFGDFVSK